MLQVDILACTMCGGRMKVLAVVEQPEVVTEILHHLGMPTVPEAPLPPGELLASSTSTWRRA